MGNILAGAEAIDRMRSRALSGSAQQALAEYEEALRSSVAAELETEIRLRRDADARAEEFRTQRDEAEKKLQAEARARAELEAGAIREKAAREAAEIKAKEAASRVAEMQQALMAERKKREAAEEKASSLGIQLAKAQAEVSVMKDMHSQMRSEKPMHHASYVVQYTDKEGRERTMNITPKEQHHGR